MSNMSNTINMSFRIDKELKQKADELFKNLGMNTSVALNMFLTQSVREQGIPFMLSMQTRKERLLDALRELEEIESGKLQTKKYKNFDEILKELD